MLAMKCLTFLHKYILTSPVDASHQGHATCLYWVSEQRTNHHSYLLATKTKVAALKTVFICPQLELLGDTPLCAACLAIFADQSNVFG